MRLSHADHGEAVDVLAELAAERRRARRQRLLDEARANPIAVYESVPWSPCYVVWELTLACNMRCAHCGSSAGKPREDELDLDEMLRVCDELAELGCERLTLLGGEPLIHPRWPDVARRVRENGFRANVVLGERRLHGASRVAQGQPRLRRVTPAPPVGPEPASSRTASWPNPTGPRPGQGGAQASAGPGGA